MMRCPHCGATVGDERVTCPHCGTTLVHGGPEEYNYGYNTGTGTGWNGSRNPGNFDMNQKRPLRFYESTLVIVLCFIFFWPLGIIFLISRVSRGPAYPDAGSTRTSGGTHPDYRGGQTVQGGTSMPPVYNQHYHEGPGLMIAGIILAVLGGMIFIAGLSEYSWRSTCTYFITGAAIVAVGASLIAVRGKRQQQAALYESLINNRGNTRISYIAQVANEAPDKTRVNLQKLINRGFLADPVNHVSAYINGEYDLVVMTHNGSPFVPVEQTMAAEIQQKRRAEDNARAKAQAAAEKARRAGPMPITDRLLYRIDDALAAPGEKLTKSSLTRMKRSILHIRQLLAESPEDEQRDNVKKLKGSYIPDALGLIDTYLKPSSSADARHQIGEMFATFGTAFENIEQTLMDKDTEEVEIDIAVMKQKLERDGVLGSDFDIK